MWDFELMAIAKHRVETVWQEAERRARLFALSGSYASEEEELISRDGGGRC